MINQGFFHGSEETERAGLGRRLHRNISQWKFGWSHNIFAPAFYANEALSIYYQESDCQYWSMKVAQV